MDDLESLVIRYLRHWPLSPALRHLAAYRWELWQWRAAVRQFGLETARVASATLPARLPVVPGLNAKGRG